MKPASPKTHSLAKWENTVTNTRMNFTPLGNGTVEVWVGMTVCGKGSHSTFILPTEMAREVWAQFVAKGAYRVAV